MVVLVPDDRASDDSLFVILLAGSHNEAQMRGSTAARRCSRFKKD